ncbi:MAG: serine--tRNA ligase [Holosporales bacterium]
MLDIRLIRETPEVLDHALARRGLPPASAEILRLDQAVRRVVTEKQALQAERNHLAKEIGARKQRGDAAEDLVARANEIKQVLPQLEEQEREDADALHHLLVTLPNILDAVVPEGADETGNVVVRTWGQPRAFTFQPKVHFELGEHLGLMSFEDAASMSGARFVVLRGALARLERALGLFMLDLQTREHGYEEVSPPLLVRDEAVFGTGQLPKFSEDLFKTTTGHWLISTAEVSLTNLVREKIVDDHALPRRFTALTPCFRSEAGAAGRDTRGMIRQHQFYKVELVSITRPEDSAAEHERMVACAEKVLQLLGLPYRVMALCAGDTGATSRRTFDLEVWLPGEGNYREISSCSNCGDYQARRMNTRVRRSHETADRGPLEFVHTLNGSGLAVGRALIAVLENYQQEDGSIVVPDVLRPYMGNETIIQPGTHT